MLETMDVRGGGNMSECLFCHSNHGSIEPCVDAKEKRSPTQTRLPLLITVLDRLVTLVGQSDCDGQCILAEPSKPCSGCLANAALMSAAQVLGAALDKINTNGEK